MILLPVIGTRVMDSAPPASTTSAMPVMMAWAAMAMVCSPEEQKRFTVWPGTLSGSPASRAARRPKLRPCSASGKAQPTITSSISAGSSWGTRSSTPRIAVAARSSGRVVARAPLNALPTGVRTLATITASLMVRPPVEEL